MWAIEINIVSVHFNLFCVTCASNYLYSCCLLIIFFSPLHPFHRMNSKRNSNHLTLILAAHQRIIITSCIVRWISCFSLKTRKYFSDRDELVGRKVLMLSLLLLNRTIFGSLLLSCLCEIEIFQAKCHWQFSSENSVR